MIARVSDPVTIETLRAAVPAGSEYVELGGAVWVIDGDEGGFYLYRIGGPEHRATCPGCGDEWEPTRPGSGIVRAGTDTFEVLATISGNEGIECSICGHEMKQSYKPYAARKV